MIRQKRTWNGSKVQQLLLQKLVPSLKVWADFISCLSLSLPSRHFSDLPSQGTGSLDSPTWTLSQALLPRGLLSRLSWLGFLEEGRAGPGRYTGVLWSPGLMAASGWPSEAAAACRVLSEGSLDHRALRAREKSRGSLRAGRMEQSLGGWEKEMDADGSRPGVAPLLGLPASRGAAGPRKVGAGMLSRPVC